MANKASQIDVGVVGGAYLCTAETTDRPVKEIDLVTYDRCLDIIYVCHATPFIVSNRDTIL